MEYDDWLLAFSKGKEEVPGVQPTDAIHSLTRYIDKSGRLWEVAHTYTDRLVVRSGQIQPDGVTVTWEKWETRHDVNLPKRR